MTLNETLEEIHSRENYKIIELDDKILKVAQTIQFPELHDRLILATAKWLDVPIISSDGDFHDVEGINAIWK
ncbi:MAG: hypothetical protein HQM13_14165 [SAR324 cluster bacterium]|nr:hypothetical protein [SAR324 cluster bacterium]